MLKLRSSNGFIIGTISLAVFTVRTQANKEKQSQKVLLTLPGHVSLRRHRPCYTLRAPNAQSRGMGQSAILGLCSDRYIRGFTPRTLSDMWMVCGQRGVAAFAVACGLVRITRIYGAT
jgi:hypothetical protein